MTPSDDSQCKDGVSSPLEQGQKQSHGNDDLDAENTGIILIIFVFLK